MTFNKKDLFMKNTTLCYMENEGSYLMLHRIKKENDENKDKWIGIGGKFEPGESPFDCVKREIIEETALIPKKLCYRGIVTFVSDIYGTEYMHLFTCPEFSGKLNTDCTEGALEWVKIDEVKNLPLWEGDKIFFKLLSEKTPYFSLKLVYESERLVSHTIEY